MEEKSLERVESADSNRAPAPSDSRVHDIDLIRGLDQADDLPAMRDLLWDIGVAVAGFATLAVAANILVLVTQCV